MFTQLGAAVVDGAVIVPKWKSPRFVARIGSLGWWRW